MIKLPPRFKIFHNVSEDYYFIKERFLFFFFFTHKHSVGYETEAIKTYESLWEAESEIVCTLEIEKINRTPDLIALVKEID